MKWLILIFGALLLFFGVIAMFSVSVYESFSFTIGLIASGKMTGDPSHYFYFLAHLKNIAIALCLGFVAYFIPTKYIKDHQLVSIGMIVMVVVQCMVFIPGIGIELNGARGWLDIPGLPSIQPSEFFKTMYIIFISSRLIRKTKQGVDESIYKSFFVVNAALLGVFVLIPDLGTVLIIGMVAVIMIWYAGAKIRDLMILGGIGFVSLIVIIGVLSAVTDKFAYITDRLSYFALYSQGGDVVDSSKTVGRQNTQALMAIGGGGFWGQGYGKGIQKFGYIPEAQSDFIFAAFSEEVGFFGNTILLGLYCGLMITVLSLTLILRDKQDRIIAIGIISLIVVQMFVNIGVNLKILPNTGVTLPFISHGGSGILVNVIQIVLLFKLCSQDILSFDTVTHEKGKKLL